MKFISSDNFEYDKVEYIVRSDASCRDKKIGLGWTIENTKTVVAEGSHTITNTTTEESEIMATNLALRTVSKMSGNSVIVKTDFCGTLDKIKHRDSITEHTRDILDTFDIWAVECVDRDELVRAHNLANYRSSEN